MRTSSPEVSNDDPTRETGSDDDSASEPPPVHVDLTMHGAGVCTLQRHHGGGVADAPSLLALWQAQEDQQYNLSLLEQHRLVGGQIYGECKREGSGGKEP